MLVEMFVRYKVKPFHTFYVSEAFLPCGLLVD